MKKRTDASFPNDKTIYKFGSKQQQASRVFEFCEQNPGYSDVAETLRALIERAERKSPKKTAVAQVTLGEVYLLKSGRFHKIGRTNAVGRRERELAIQLPEKANVVHSIKTDDPNGIESYWHRRFENKHKNGEWYELTAEDIAAFKRRKFM
ncbi:MAG TPA: GIY-YIG nuclease family protein [Pyrinomonadaceae bacterium]|nr:GIY-YIG nuclease family protein [Pyrinomonadaceae bacterium]